MTSTRQSQLDEHLDERSLIEAVVSEAMVTPGTQAHLVACGDCRARKERLERQLARLGDLGARLAPVSRRRFSLPARQSRLLRLWDAWAPRKLLVGATAAALVVLVLWALPWLPHRPPGVEERWYDDPLMSEIQGLEDNALPSVCLNITGERDLTSYQEFMDFVAPMPAPSVLSIHPQTASFA